MGGPTDQVIGCSSCAMTTTWGSSTATCTVEALDPTEQELLLRLDDGREVKYPNASLFALTHAYAISVHKASGAEFQAVVIPLVTSHAPLLGRTLLYTALTRARQLLVLVGQ